MAKRRKRKKALNPFKKIKRETTRAVVAIFFFALGLFLILASLSMAGVVGRWFYGFLSNILGVGYYILPILSFVLGASFLKSEEDEIGSIGVTKGLGSLIFFLSGLGIVDLLSGDGGMIGKIISKFFVGLFDFYAGLIILIALLIISLLVIFEAKLTLDNLFFWRRFRSGEDYENDEDEYEYEDEDEEDEEEEEEEEKKQFNIKGLMPFAKGSNTGASFMGPSGKKYIPPPLSLLRGDRGKPGVGDIKANANIIKRTLRNFGIDVEMDEISIGPSVTRYALKPAEGVKLARIVALKNDLALALAAHPLRIEAPIPGKSLVGIEIPNSSKTTVGLATLLSGKEYQDSDKSLVISMGRGVSGKTKYTDLSKLPHLLIAGATGSGKSVTIHTIINSLIFRNSPENLRFIMIDPKRVELTLYNGIPHLLSPVITNPKKAILALKWAANEMERRYDILEAEQVRDIASYHKNVLIPYLANKPKGDDASAPSQMPYIVIVLDELADIMSTYPRELEAAIVRLAQMSRATGIHLILSTQRPSVKIITGLIKANIPGRVALQVASQIDSRTILDQGGAESLLGAGDMLFISGEMSKPIRLQSAFISEEEVKKVVKYLKKTHEDDLPTGFDITEDENVSDFDTSLNGDFADEDELYDNAYQTVIEAGKASTSYLQRKLRIGYARAARLMDTLEERGIIGPQDGAKPREVLEERENYEKKDGFLEEEELEDER